MTKLTYLEDFDVESRKAVIVSVTKGDERHDIVLDATCFYPRGGGQDWDTGIIYADNNEFEVNEVRLDENGDVHHFGLFKKGEFVVGDQVECKVDHERRNVNTRLHSAGHVIDMAIDAVGLDWVATKGQHYTHLSAIEYQGSFESEQSEELKQKIEQKANELVSEGLANAIKFMPVEEMSQICRHVPDNIPSNKPARVVVYGDSFGVPCGGTHVSNLGEVGKINIPKIKSKKGVIRVNYTVEGINS